MANVKIPAVGTGDSTPIVSTDNVTADSSQVQNVQWVTVSGGVLARVTPLQSGGNVVITGTVPLPTGASTETTLAAVNSKLGSALPLPTGAATQTTLAALLSALGTPLQAGGNVGVTSSALPTGAATQTTLASVLSALQGTLAVSGSFTSSGTADVSTTATITTTGSTTLTGLAGLSTLSLLIGSGTQSGVTDIVEGSNDGGTTWVTLGYTVLGANTILFSSLTGAAGIYMYQIAGFNQVRYRVAAITSGTYNVALRASAGVWNTRTVTAAVTGTVTANLGTLNGAATASGVAAVNTTLGTPMQQTGGSAIALPAVAGTATLTQVSGSASTGTIIAANATRKGAVIVNDSTAVLKVAFAATATASAYTYLIPAGGTLELPTAGRAIYQGLISGIWASATGNAVVTDLS